MIDELNAGIELMLVGMGVVFMFLTLLVLAINVMSSLIMHLLPQNAPQQKARETDSGTIAAITAAVKLYRTGHK